MNQRKGAWVVALLVSLSALSVNAAPLPVDNKPADLSQSRLHTTHARLNCNDCHSDKAPFKETLRAQAIEPACVICHKNGRPSLRLENRSWKSHPRFQPGDDCKTCHKSPAGPSR